MAACKRAVARLVKHEPTIDPGLRAFLGRTYNLKAIADYETGPGATETAEQAREAIADAHRFIAAGVALISI